MSTMSLMAPSAESPQETRSSDRAHGGVFYRCQDVQNCGMRFPVTSGDPFRGCCPRCGATVQLVAAAATDAFSLAGDHGKTSAAPLTSGRRLHLLLDNWRSLFNVGAAFRTADGAGVQHLYLCGITATPAQQQKLAKTALGAEREVAWSYHPDAVTLVRTLQSQGALLWVLERSPVAHSLFDITLLGDRPEMPDDSPIVLAAGNEVLGVDPGLVAIADRVVQLPMHGTKQSLNVAVALSIATYWLVAQGLAVQDGQQMTQRAVLRDEGQE